MCMRSDQEHGHGHPLRSVALKVGDDKVGRGLPRAVSRPISYDNDHETSLVISEGGGVNGILTPIYYLCEQFFGLCS